MACWRVCILATVHGKFSLWLALLNCCCTADRLPKWGLPHPSCCLLCDQRDEIMQRLLISHVFLWQVWFFIVQQVRLEFMADGTASHRLLMLAVFRIVEPIPQTGGQANRKSLQLRACCVVYFSEGYPCGLVVWFRLGCLFLKSVACTDFLWDVVWCYVVRFALIYFSLPS